MPMMPTIVIHTDALKKIIEAVESERVGPMKIKIVDNGEQYAVRDCNDFLISYVPKKIPVEDPSK